ncbi:hypothetical protein PENTCL1PPCAC_10503, partial [Pristionchus entomophagus]
FVCLAFLRAGCKVNLLFKKYLISEVMHRNFRMQLCLATVYYTVQIYCRFILLYYELNDILPRSWLYNLLFWVETIRDSILGYFCALPGSFVLERFFATKY